MSNWNSQMMLLAEIYRRGMQLRPGEEFHIEILHDDSCHRLDDRGPCNCDSELGAIWVERPTTFGR